MSNAARHGFTLLEVLVAIAILGLGLTAILGAQAGLFASATRAERMTVAANLVRCQMEEAERKLLREGFPALDEKEEGDCCDDEGDGIDGFRCVTNVERVVLPEPAGLTEDGGVGSGEESDSLGPLGVLSKLQTAEGMSGADAPTSLQGISEAIGESGAAEGMGPMVMGMVYPTLKPMLEASIRRITVTVEWTEGIRSRDLKVTQFVAYPQMGGLDLVDGGVPPDEETKP